MTNTMQVTMRMDSDLVNESKVFLKDCGLSFNQGIQLLLRKMLIERRIVVEPMYNEETLAAFKEAENIAAHPEKYKSYSSAAELHKAIVAEEE